MKKKKKCYHIGKNESCQEQKKILNKKKENKSPAWHITYVHYTISCYIRDAHHCYVTSHYLPLSEFVSPLIFTASLPDKQIECINPNRNKI